MNAIPFAVVGASLLGSGHCVGMCGGLAISVGRSSGAVVQYHLGRLIGYLSLGALAGSLGQAVLSGNEMSVVSWVATVFLAAGFISLGVHVWRGKGAHLFALPNRVISVLFKKAGGQPLSVGLLSALLPCGWLHGFVLGAVATRSALAGVVFLFAFWLGTVPALSFAPWLVDRVLRPVAQRVPRLCALLLISAGVLALGVRASSLMMAKSGEGAPCPHCHH